MGWLIALGILAALAVLPLGISARYNSGGLLVKVIAGPVRFTVFPLRKKEKKEPSKTEKPATPAERLQNRKKAAAFWTFCPL